MKSERLVRLLSVILFVVFLPGLTLAQAPGEVPQRSIRGPDIILKLELPSYEIIRDEEGFDVIRAEGFSLSGMPGDPGLPRKVYNVAVPPDAALDSLSLEVVDAQVVRLPGVYHLRLATPDLPAIEGDIAGYHSGYTPASDAASTDPVKLLPPGQKRKYRFTRLEFTPFQYDAASGELSLVSELTVRINYDVSLAAKDEVLLGDIVMDDVARQLLVNYDAAQAWYQVTGGQDEPGDVYNYVIITTNAIETGSSKLANFITHKQSLGYSVLTITEDEYGSLVGQSPNGTAEKIRKWLQDNYVAYSIEYVLLIGDPDPDDPSSGSDSVGDVPMKMCWPRRTETSDKESPTDYFFADLTGNWDLDGDGYFGEWSDYTGTGGVDFANEVYVGRIPVYSGAYSTLDDILQKIIDYENEANPEAWRESALLPMSFSTSTYDGAPLAEQMLDDYLDAAGFSSWTQYQQGNGACSLDSTYASDEELRGGTVVRDRWAANDYGLILWWGHGSQTSASVGCDGCWDGTLFNSAQTSSLDDDHPSFTYQCSCTNGYPENSNNLQYALLKQGGIGTVSATRVSWFNTGVGYGDFDGSTTNSGIGYEYAQRLVQGQAAGDALYNAKVSMTPGSSTRLMNYYDFNLYGDPSTGLPAATTPSAQWTFLVYLDGDNNLEGAGIDDFLEMSSVGSDSGVNIVVQFDRIPGYNTGYGDWTTTKRFLVTPGMTPTSGNALQDIGEANMGDPQTLVDFVQWGMANYPADHYAVILWNHGSGWRLIPDEIPLIKGVIYDDTDGDHIDMPELRSAMDTLSNDGSDPLDLVGFDACLMAMIEVDNQLIPYVDVRVGSEETEPGDGWPYDDVLLALSGNPAMSASQLGTVIVDEYYASYGNDETQSAVDLHSPYGDLNSAVDDFAVVLINGVGSHYTDIATARSNTQEFDSTYIDLYDFAYQVNQYVSDGTINAAATDVMNAVNSAVIHEQHGATWPGAHGISIYFPESEGAYDSTYDGDQGWLEFTANTQWDEWLHAFYSPPAPDIGVSPTSFEETVLQGEMVTKILTINNTGGGDLEFDIWESTTMLGSGLTLDKTVFSNSTAKKPPEGLHLPSMPSGWMPLDVMLDEGFEGGVVPPTEWELIQTNAAETWEIDTSDPHSGSYRASCFYDPALNSQDEVLLSPVLNLSSGNLNFWSLGSLYWCRDDSDNCDLSIWLIVGTWGGGDDVFVGKADDDWTDTWVWSESTYDLTPLLPGGPIRLGFQYEGLDGAQISIDDIVVAGDLAPDVPWLSEDPISGTVSAGGSLPVDVILDATGLALGDYTADLVIHSNDPDENPVTVPVVMHVTDNNPPNKPSSPSPTDGATDQDINVDLGWTGGDPDAGDTVTYDVYFEAGDSTPDNLICNDVSTPACDPGTLDYSTHYYWYVVATDNHAASTTGDTWDFTTAPAPAPPAIISITANSGNNNKVVHITNLAGNDFQSGAAVRLIKTGQADIVATNVVMVSASQITCDFDLRGASPGQRTVRVTNPDTQYAELYNGFTVKGLVFLPTVLRNH